MSDTQKTDHPNTISTADLVERMRQNQEIEVWNVLTDEYFNGELIEGTRRVALDQIGREAAGLASLAKDAEIVVYCAGPDCPQSHYAFEKLIHFGFTNVRVYEGGLQEWSAAGFNIERENEKTATQSCH